MEQFISIILFLVLIYVVLGILFSVIFIVKGLKKVDHGVEDSGRFFKVLIFPGLVTFWPMFLLKWKKS